MIVSYEGPAQSGTQQQAKNVSGHVAISDIQWNAEKRTATIGETTVLLTPMQYRLLSPLRHSTPIAYTELSRLAYHCEIDDKVRTMIDKHIDRIRGKLRGTGIYIYCVLGYGYLLFDEGLPDSGGRPSTSRRKRLM